MTNRAKQSSPADDKVRAAEIVRTARALARAIHRIDGGVPDDQDRPYALTGSEWMDLVSLANVIVPPEQE